MAKSIRRTFILPLLASLTNALNLKILNPLGELLTDRELFLFLEIVTPSARFQTWKRFCYGKFTLGWHYLIRDKFKKNL